MATKKLESEFINLKKEFIGLQDLIQNLLDKHGNLEKKYEKFIQKQRKNNSKCRNCSDQFQSLSDFKKHKEDGCSTSDFKCDECEKCFKDENKLQDHTEKVHIKFECDECEKVFKYETILEKHKEASHENVELYCHYFNNDKDCPFEDECIYLHEESDNCKYGKQCARKFCMFKHEDTNEEDECETDEDSDDDVDLGVNGIDLNKIKPVLEKFKKVVEHFEELMGEFSLKCKHCEFEAKDRNGLTMHIKAKHDK